MVLSKGNTNNRMSIQDKEDIVEYCESGMTPIEISRKINLKYSNTAIRLFLNSKGYTTKKKIVDRSRPCKVCGDVFTPKSHDGIKKRKYVLCSDKCRRISVTNDKKKYTVQQVNHVIQLKKLAITNAEIERISGVNLNKIKEIIKENALYVGTIIAQKNAYNGKLKKNPNAMQDMRACRLPIPEFQYKLYIEKIIVQLTKKDNRYSIPYLCKQYNLNDNSIRNTLHAMGHDDLIKNQFSMGESEVMDFIKFVLPDVVVKQGDRSILTPKEIDIYIPELNLGIEYCGVYWHSETAGKDKEYHKDKMTQANQLGIRLITIFEDEWMERQAQVKNFLKSILDVHEKRIFARNCTVKEVNKEMAKLFLDANHIQGKTKSEIAIGLYCNEILVGLITGNKHHRNTNIDSLVLNRLVFKDGHQVVGGASRLLKHLISYAKEHNYNKIISWSDNRWSEGAVYKKCNFTLDGTLPPDYSYVYRGKRIPKQSCKKANLLKKGAMGQTEREMATYLGYHRIWDCGKKRWIIEL